MMSEEIRHKLPDRLFHWVMAILVIVLLGTAFLPILGVKFDWVPLHWISGIFLIAAVLFHLYRALFVHSLKEMLPTAADFSMSSSPEQKYDVNQKLYHWSVGTILLALLITGGIMMAKIDTPFWKRDPSILTDWNWGIVYSVHGGASLLLIFFFILHIYFAVLPEHRVLLQSMVFGSPKKRPNK
ncbi:MAG: cytochrome b/b6 domain-containing protein [Alphaproteobacteria bacterium]